MNYNYIVNPLTNRKCSIYSRNGQNILKNYLNQQGGACDLCGAEGVTKATCPHNPNAKNPKQTKHNQELKEDVRIAHRWSAVMTGPPDMAGPPSPPLPVHIIVPTHSPGLRHSSRRYTGWQQSPWDYERYLSTLDSSTYMQDSCPICFGDYVDDTLICILRPCGHIICKDCVMDYPRRDEKIKDCPICRQKITKIECAKFSFLKLQENKRKQKKE